MPTKSYQGIIFPDRAESLEESVFADYKIFLDHWDILSQKIRFLYEDMALRGATKSLAIFGSQGSGKTLFARKLKNDFANARETGTVSGDKNNLWHRITGGASVDSTLILKATLNTEIFYIESDRDWVKKLKNWRAHNTGRHAVVIADNAERVYFKQGLLNLTDAEYLQLGSSDESVRLAAENFVSLCRTELRGALFVMFTNNDLFALSFEEHVNAQHKGLLSIEQIPIPTNRDKETVVRVNINRINPISYWYCLDKAGPDAKNNIYSDICGAETYPGTFQSVDRALKEASSARVGRPGSKCTITLAIFANGNDFSSLDLSPLGHEFIPRLDYRWLTTVTYLEDWAQPIIGTSREASLLESEWNLRLIIFGDPFVHCLLSSTHGNSAFSYCKELLSFVETVHTPGTRTVTRESYSQDLCSLIDKYTSDFDQQNEEFWRKGITRNIDYEGKLKIILPNYNTGGQGFLTYRPDYIVTPYNPCSVLGAERNDVDQISASIKRQANVFEFTAIKDVRFDKITAYLKTQKLPNYINITQEQ